MSMPGSTGNASAATGTTVRPATPPNACARSSMLKGLNRQAFIPAARQRARSDACALAVTASTWQARLPVRRSCSRIALASR
ncbi:hypothetical protein D9M71_829460 [compost metagenome]